MLIKPTEQPQLANKFAVLMCWMNNRQLFDGNKYVLRHGSRIKAIGKQRESGKVTIKTAEPLLFDSYPQLLTNEVVLLIDQTRHLTMGTCPIL